MLKEGDYVHIEATAHVPSSHCAWCCTAFEQVDLRGLHLPFGTLAVAINSEPAEAIGPRPLVPSGPTNGPMFRRSCVMQVGCQTVFDDIALSSRPGNARLFDFLLVSRSPVCT